MDQQVIGMVLKEGVFAGLFIWLFITTMRTNKERETKYQEVISENQKVISEQSKAFSSLSQDVTEIKQILVERDDK